MIEFGAVIDKSPEVSLVLDVGSKASSDTASHAAAELVRLSLERFQQHDWGSADDNLYAANDAAARSGDRIVAHYEVPLRLRAEFVGAADAEGVHHLLITAEAVELDANPLHRPHIRVRVALLGQPGTAGGSPAGQDS